MAQSPEIFVGRALAIISTADTDCDHRAVVTCQRPGAGAGTGATHRALDGAGSEVRANDRASRGDRLHSTGGTGPRVACAADADYEPAESGARYSRGDP